MLKPLDPPALALYTLLLLFGTSIGITFAGEDKRCTHNDCAITPYGHLELKRKEVEKKRPDGTGEERVTDITLDSRVIGTIDHGTNVVEVHPGRENATLFLIYGSDHGNSCELYRVLEIKSKTDFALTNEFGTCGSIVEKRDFKIYRLKKSIVYENGEWRFAFYSGKTAGKWHVAWYSYRDGIIYQGNKPASTPSDDPEWLMKKKLEMEVPDEKEREALLVKYGNATEAYHGLLLDRMKKIDPSKFRGAK